MSQLNNGRGLVRNAIEKYVPKTLFKSKTENYELLHIMAELEELEAKAAKWDMIQWAVDEQVPFVQKYDGGCIIVNKKDLGYIKQLYDKRGV